MREKPGTTNASSASSRIFGNAIQARYSPNRKHLYPVAMTSNVTEFIGVYDADSTLIGEVSYWIGARLGRTHCSLCELTHGLFTQKNEWKECTKELSVPFHTFHRNDAPDDVLTSLNGSFPAVLIRTDDGLSVILTKQALESFDGNTTDFAQWLSDYLINS